MEMGDDVVPIDLGSGPNLTDGPGWVACLAEHRPDAIYHLAGWSDVGGSWDNPTDTFEVNVLGTVNLLEAARTTSKAKVLLVSSADVYGSVETTDLPLTESSLAQPNSPYGASKQAAEAIAMHYWRSRDLDVVIARPFNHFGPGQRPQFVAPAFASQIADLERSGGGVLQHGNLSAKRDLTDVRDVVRAYRLLITNGIPGEIYNVCSGSAISMQQLLDTMVERANAEIETAIDQNLLRPVDQPIVEGSHAKLAGATGWHPEVSFVETISDLMDDARRRSGRPSEKHLSI